MVCAPNSIKRYLDESERTLGFGGTSKFVFLVTLAICMSASEILPSSTGHRDEIGACGLLIF